MRVRLLGHDHLDVATPLNNLSRLYYFQGKYSEAERYLQRALDIREKGLPPNHPLRSLTLYNLAKLKAARDQPEEALNLMQRALRIDESILDNVFSGSSEEEKANIWILMGYRFQDLISLVGQKMSHRPEAVRIAFDTVLRHKGIIVEAVSQERRTFSAGDPRIEEWARQLQLVYSCMATLAVVGPSRKSHEAYIQRMEELRGHKNRLEEELSRMSSANNVIRQSQQADAERIRQKLPPGSALLEYASYPIRDFHPGVAQEEDVLTYKYFAFILHAGDSSQPVLIDLGEAAPLDTAIHAFRQEIAEVAQRLPEGRDEKEAEKRLAEKGKPIYEGAFAPLESALAGCKTIYIAPDAELNLIPFGVLQDEDGHYLIETYQFNYITSGRDLLRFTEKKTAGNSVVIVADPDYDLMLFKDTPRAMAERQSTATSNTTPLSTFFKGIVWDRLGHTLDEAEAIAKELSGQETVIYSDKEAVEGIVKKVKSPLILHIATHGFFIDEESLEGIEQSARPATGSSPDRESEMALQTSQSVQSMPAKLKFSPLVRCGLVFAGANRLGEFDPVGDLDDGILTALEVSAIPLWETDLVVLSACDTGVGKAHRGDGVFGLRRAFQLAGARTVVMSLWSVPSTATTILMTDFYRRLNAGEGKAQALQNAALAVMKERYDQNGAAHPCYWGGFICVGSPAQIELQSSIE
jgi:CHAT domain-containing protein